MVQFDNQYKQVKLKIVYYGPALGGKTSCLQHVHRVIDPARRTKLYSLNTASDRTLFFDLLALDLGRVRGYRLTLQLYTVPGQVQYNATRRAVLAGADGVVFVADSQRSQAAANAESIKNLADNLQANGLDVGSLPLVVQYNKRDLPDLFPRVELERALNPGGCPSFETIATTGQGVMEAFSAICEATVRSVADRLGLAAQPDALTRLVATVRTALQPYVPRSGATAESAVVTRPAATGEAALSHEELVAEAVRANVAMTELNTRLDGLTRHLERRNLQLRAINDFGRLMALAREPEEITTGLLERVLSDVAGSCGSVVLVDERGELVEVQRRGLAAEPLLRRDEHGAPAAGALLASRQPFMARADELEPTQILAAPWLEELRDLELAAVIAVPLLAQDRALGLLACYADAARGPFEDSDLELVTVLCANAAVALANARAWRSLEQLNRSLGDAVADRTVELEQALRRMRALAEELEERNLELETANEKLRELERLKSDLLSRVAHELNTPVTAISTAARILARYDEVPAEKAAKFVGIIGQESARLAELISSALEAVVLGVREGAPPAARLGVADLLRRVLGPLRGDLAQRGLSLQVRIAAGLDTIDGDGEQLEAALRAVVRNAIEFNREGGSVTIVARPLRRGGETLIELRVEDSGVGIAAEELPHVTEVFWQGGNVLTGKPRGLGLGLAVARRVAESHGGALEISSEPGKGTTVSLLIASSPAAVPA